jgi:hypothetical protein
MIPVEPASRFSDAKNSQNGTPLLVADAPAPKPLSHGKEE